ncbi:MAG: preprotein translocase subunit TatC [Deltaproteobacteria bacterium RIFOXYD12_FULL_50_9]|nr:MAG: preprotein translocase subunit TatC [Deltaproteobacteria bacterium RIFOXYD12_FULL_50_9]
MDIDKLKVDDSLDTQGLICPMPLLKTKKAIAKLESGQILEVIGSDPGSKNDLPGWCERSGHSFLGFVEGDGVLKFYIKKG